MSDGKAPIPSRTQAREIARLWADGRFVAVATVDGYVDATTKAMVKRGWLEPTGETGVYPSGANYVRHRLSQSGVGALLSYLLHHHHRGTQP